MPDDPQDGAAMIVRMGLRMARTTHPEDPSASDRRPGFGWFVPAHTVRFGERSLDDRARAEQGRKNVHALATNEASPSDMFVVLRDDSWQGEQYPGEIWIQPASKADPVIPVKFWNGCLARARTGSAVSGAA